MTEEQRRLVEEALGEAEGLAERSGYSAAEKIRDLLREVVKLYREGGEILVTLSYEERHEKRPCKGCGETIQPRQSYDPVGPYHIGCAVLHDRRPRA